MVKVLTPVRRIVPAAFTGNTASADDGLNVPSPIVGLQRGLHSLSGKLVPHSKKVPGTTTRIKHTNNGVRRRIRGSLARWWNTFQITYRRD